jgi:hypothetical protein
VACRMTVPCVVTGVETECTLQRVATVRDMVILGETAEAVTHQAPFKPISCLRQPQPMGGHRGPLEALMNRASGRARPALHRLFLFLYLAVNLLPFMDQSVGDAYLIWRRCSSRNCHEGGGWPSCLTSNGSSLPCRFGTTSIVHSLGR